MLGAGSMVPREGYATCAGARDGLWCIVCTWVDRSVAQRSDLVREELGVMVAHFCWSLPRLCRRLWGYFEGLSLIYYNNVSSVITRIDGLIAYPF